MLGPRHPIWQLLHPLPPAHLGYHLLCLGEPEPFGPFLHPSLSGHQKSTQRRFTYIKGSFLPRGVRMDFQEFGALGELFLPWGHAGP